MFEFKQLYQYHVYNNHCNTIITVDIDDEEYVNGFAKRCLKDFYGKTEEEVSDLKLVFICKFSNDSIINLDLLN